MIPALTARIGAWQRASAHRRVLSAAVVVASFSFGGKIVAAAKDVLVAQRFGTSDDVDAFLLALLLPSFAISVIGGSLNTALIPAYVEARERDGAGAAQRLLSTTLVLSLALLVAAAAILAALIPVLVPLISSKFSPAKMHLVRQLSFLLMPCLIVAGVSMTWAAVLNAHQRFAPPAAAAVAIPLGAILGLAVLGRAWGIHALAAGTLAGFCAEAAWVGAALHRLGISLRPRWSGFTADVRRVVGQYAPMAAGMLFMATNPVIDSVMSARLGSGSVAALGYGNKIVSFVNGIGVVAIGSAVLPHFSQLVAHKEWDALGRTVRKYAAVVFWVSVPATLAGVALSVPMVRLLFERGAFGASDTSLVARIQSLYLLGVPFVLTSMLYVRLISAIASNRALMWMNVINTVTNVVGNIVFSRYLGVAGIALSTSSVYAISCAMALYYARRRLRSLAAQAAVNPRGVGA